MRSSCVLAPHKDCKTCENLLLTLPDRLCTPASRMASEFWGQIPSAFAVSNVEIFVGLKSLHPAWTRALTAPFNCKRDYLQGGLIAGLLYMVIATTENLFNSMAFSWPSHGVLRPSPDVARRYTKAICVATPA
jgi:hypothetical protein